MKRLYVMTSEPVIGTYGRITSYPLTLAFSLAARCVIHMSAGGASAYRPDAVYEGNQADWPSRKHADTIHPGHCPARPAMGDPPQQHPFHRRDLLRGNGRVPLGHGRGHAGRP